MLIMQDSMHVWGQKEFQEIFILSPQFYCEPKTTVKKLSIF